MIISQLKGLDARKYPVLRTFSYFMMEYKHPMSIIRVIDILIIEKLKYMYISITVQNMLVSYTYNDISTINKLLLRSRNK